MRQGDEFAVYLWPRCPALIHTHNACWQAWGQHPKTQPKFLEVVAQVGVRMSKYLGG